MKKTTKNSAKNTKSKAKFSLSKKELTSLASAELVQVSGGAWPGTMPFAQKHN